MALSDPKLEADVLAILKRVSPRPIEPTRESDLLLDLGFDSLLRLELIAELEDHFDILIPLDVSDSIRTVADVHGRVRALLAQASRP